jgi:hypothetical protein
MIKPTSPIAIMPLITVDVEMLSCACTIMKPTPVDATISSAPIRDCHPSPADTLKPAVIDDTEDGSSTSRMIRQLGVPSICAASTSGRLVKRAPR